MWHGLCSYHGVECGGDVVFVNKPSLRAFFVEIGGEVREVCN
jgi:hypothetical protein